MKNLYLFDIDGTLVNINDVHLHSYKLDYSSVLQRDVPDETLLKYFGMSEADIHPVIFRELNIPYNSDLIRKLIEGHPSNFKRAIGSTDIKPLKGVVEFLSQLRNNGEYVAAITGNLEEPARLILDRAGLTQFFKYLVFDDGKSERKQIVRRAVDEAKRRGYNFNKIVVIGDTTYDIEAGKYVKAFTVGVGTGSDDLNKLKMQNPAILLHDLTQYRRILQAIK